MKSDRRLAVRKTYKLFIGGAFPRSESGRTLRIESEDGTVTHISHASRKDLRDAVTAARKAHAGWSGRTAFNRGQILYRIGELLEGRRAQFERQLVDGFGVSTDDAEFEVSASIDTWLYYAGWCDKYAQVFGSVNPVAGPFLNVSEPRSTGVVCAFAPPSAPVAGLAGAIAPVLAAGNTVVAITSAQAAPAAIELAEVLATSDVPGGVVNVLTSEVDELLPDASSHRDIDAVAAWGLTEAQRRAAGAEGAQAIQRQVFRDDPGPAHWRSGAARSPYRIAPVTELQTVWHPRGA